MAGGVRLEWEPELGSATRHRSSEVAVGAVADDHLSRGGIVSLEAHGNVTSPHPDPDGRLSAGRRGLQDGKNEAARPALVPKVRERAEGDDVDHPQDDPPLHAGGAWPSPNDRIRGARGRL